MDDDVIYGRSTKCFDGTCFMWKVGRKLGPHNCIEKFISNNGVQSVFSLISILVRLWRITRSTEKDNSFPKFIMNTWYQYFSSALDATKGINLSTKGLMMSNVNLNCISLGL